jgi:hypothetical protein
VQLGVQDLTDRQELEWGGQQGCEPACETREHCFLLEGEIASGLLGRQGPIPRIVHAVPDPQIGQPADQMALKPRPNNPSPAHSIHLPEDSMRVVPPNLRSFVADANGFVPEMDDCLCELEGVGQVGGEAGREGGQGQDGREVGLVVALVGVIHFDRSGASTWPRASF